MNWPRLSENNELNRLIICRDGACTVSTLFIGVEDLDLLEFGIPAHPNSAASSGNVDGDETAAKDKDKGGSSVDTVRILLILGMFVPIVIILVVLFRPRKKFARSRSDREAEDDDY